MRTVSICTLFWKWETHLLQWRSKPRKLQYEYHIVGKVERKLQYRLQQD